MPYGTIKVDNIVFTNAGSDQTITVSGLVASTSGNLTVTGTISGNTIQGQTVSGVTVTGTTANFTSGNFTTITGGTVTLTSGVIASGTAANPSLSILGDANTGLYSPGADQLAISTSGAQRLVVDASGNINLGQASSALQSGGTGLTVYGASSSEIKFLNSSTGSAATDGTALVATSTTFTINNREAGPIILSTSNSERLRITDGGLVGVGTSSPSYLLHVSGNGAEIGLTDTAVANATWRLLASTGGSTKLFRIYDSSNAADRFVIDSSGRVGVGTTNPGSILTVSDPGTGLAFTNAASGNYNIGLLGGTGSAEAYVFNRANSPLIFGTNNQERLRITAAGLVGIGTSSPGAKLDVSGDVIVNGGGVQFPIQFANAFTPNSQRADLLITANATSNNALRVGTIASNGGVTLQGTRQSDSSQKVNLVLNPDGGSVGIGSTTAEKIFTVLKNGDSGLYIKSADTNHSNLQLGVDTANSYSFIQSGSAGSGSALNMAFFVGSSERARLDTSGRLLVGTSSSRSYRVQYGTTSISADAFQLQGESSGFAGASFITNRNADNGGSYLILGKSRGANPGGVTAVQSGDNLGSISFSGADGSDFDIAATIRCDVDGTPGTDDMPGRLVFSTTADGASSPTEAMRINNQRELLIGTTTRTANGGVLQVSNGITFPATAVACTNVNTLDDYEEGTHTATLTPSGSGSITLNATYQTLTYTKVGRLVSIRGTLIASSSSSPVGYVTVSLPFTPAAVSGIGYAGGSVFVDAATGVNANQFVLMITTGGARIYLGDGTALQPDSAQAIASAGQIYLEMNYHV